MKSAGEASEAGLVPRGRRSDDSDGWREIVHRFAPYVHGVSRVSGLSDEEAANVFDEVFARTWIEIDRLEGDDPLRARVVELTEQIVQGTTASAPPSEALQTLRQALEVHEAARGLPASQRELLQRGVIDGETPATIAEALGIREDAVAEQLGAARMRLRGRIRRKAFNLPEERLRRHDRA